MGAWGPGVFSDDVAVDARGEYRRLLEDGLTDEKALAEILAANAETLQDSDDKPVFLVALALTMHALGRLTDEVKHQAVQVIDDEEGMARWVDEGPKVLAQRRTALARARRQLLTPQGPRRAVRSPRKPVTDLEPGDLLAYTNASGTVELLRVVEVFDCRYFTAPRFAMLDWDGIHLPPIDQIANLADRPPTLPGPGYRLAGGMGMKVRGHDWRDAGFRHIGRITARPASYPAVLQASTRWTSYARALDFQAARRADGHPAP